MIVAHPEDFSKFRQFPLTLTLLLLNFLIYFMVFDSPDSHQQRHKLLKAENLILTARLYLQSIPHFEASYQNQIPEWVLQVHRGNLEQMEILGSYALRDNYFLKYGERASFVGDQIEIENWKGMIQDFQKYVQKQPVFYFGLFHESSRWGWITYQFSHSGFLHLMSNMIFLVFSGFAVETLVGGWGLLAIYLLGGLAGGLMFLLFNQNGALPMVGASASISALIAFFCLAETKWRIRYFYFLSPVQGHFGSIYLTPLLMLPLYVLVDFTNLLAAPTGLNMGVAYSAHVGGSLFGLGTAVFYRLISEKQKQKHNRPRLRKLLFGKERN